MRDTWHEDRIPREQQKRWRRLVRKILGYGGEDVVPPFGGEDDLTAILERGMVWDDDVNFIECAVSRCHGNISEMFLGAWDDNVEFTIVTGYALNGGLWRQHTWGFYDGEIIETTVERERYYGAALTDDEAQVFAGNNW